MECSEVDDSQQRCFVCFVWENVMQDANVEWRQRTKLDFEMNSPALLVNMKACLIRK